MSLNAAATEEESSVLLSPPLIAAHIPLSLYVHLPWCARKCPYCDFNSHKAPTVVPEKEYIAALLRDVESVLPTIWGRRVQTVFIGGGTPSLFSARAIDNLLCGLRTLSLLPPQTEISLEANPDSADADKFAEFAAAGINRISLGVQSFDDRMLAALGRVHDGKAAQKAATITAAVFDNFNIDLMHALPGQTTAMAKDDINIALRFSPPHLSLYQLTLEVGTPFFRSPPPLLPSVDKLADIGEAAAALAIAAGFERYEISAFARDKKYCRHNLNYWRFGDYIGIGAGAHAKITENGKIYRYERIKNPRDYMRHVGTENVVAKKRVVGGKEAVFEFMLNALRLSGGFAPTLLSERAGAAAATAADILESCEKDGLLNWTPANICPTAAGLRYLNDMLLRFLPD